MDMYFIMTSVQHVSYLYTVYNSTDSACTVLQLVMIISFAFIVGFSLIDEKLKLILISLIN